MTDSSPETSTASEDLIIRVPIHRALEEYSPTPDHVRGAKYGNLLLDEDIGQGDVVDAVLLEDVRPAFFERVEAERGLDPETDDLYAEFKRDRDIICLADRDDLPEEFEPATQPATDSDVDADGGGRRLTGLDGGGDA